MERSLYQRNALHKKRIRHLFSFDNYIMYSPGFTGKYLIHYTALYHDSVFNCQKNKWSEKEEGSLLIIHDIKPFSSTVGYEQWLLVKLNTELHHFTARLPRTLHPKSGYLNAPQNSYFYIFGSKQWRY